MLLDEDRGRSEDGHLLSVLDGLERRADGDLGLSVSNVPADQQVHGPRQLHSPLHLLRDALLVGRLVVDERRLHLALPARVGAEGVRVADPAGGVELEELSRHGLNRVLRPLLQLLPVTAPQAVEARRRVIRAVLDIRDPAFHQIGAVVGHPEEVALRVLDHQRLQLFARDADALQPAVAPDAVVEVNDIVAGHQRRERLQRRPTRRAWPSLRAARATEYLVIGEKPERRIGVGGHEPRREWVEAQRDLLEQRASGRLLEDLL